jgi:hypothetical protein
MHRETSPGKYEHSAALFERAPGLITHPHYTYAVKPLLYLETTIVSYLTARATREPVMAARQQITLEWWNRRREDFQLAISPLVLAEAARGDAAAAERRLVAIRDLTSLDINDEVIPIAEALLEAKLIPPNAADDALHIGIASFHSAHFLLTWNFRHIANAENITGIQELIRRFGYHCPVICTPEELLGELP